jgi:isocitrate dehydrogenase
MVLAENSVNDHKVVDAAVEKAYNGKKSIVWMEARSEKPQKNL